MPTDTMLESPLPNNLDAERSVLGAIMLDNNALNPAIENLRPKISFWINIAAFSLQMIALGEAQQAIDLITLTEELHRLRRSRRFRRRSLSRFSRRRHAPRLQRGALRPHRQRKSDPAQSHSHDPQHPACARSKPKKAPTPFSTTPNLQIFALAEDRVSAGLIPIKDIVRDNFERLERIFREGKSITGVPPATAELDKLTSGFQPSELLIFAARPSQGKTALALNLAENMAIRSGHPWPFSASKCRKSRCCNVSLPPSRRSTPTNFAPAI